MNAETATVMNLPAPPAVQSLAAWSERDTFELALRKAKVYAASTLVPAQYQDNIPNCLIAMNMAKRIGSDELQTMQNLYIVQGKPGWSGQFLIATFNQCGKFTALRFEWRGQQGDKDWACRAFATEKATGEKIHGSWVSWKMVEAEGWNKKSGSKWLTMPDQMFMYRAAAFLVRTHAPEIAMGLQTVEELRDVIDIEAEPAPTKAAALASVLQARMAPAQPEVPATARPVADPPPPLALEPDLLPAEPVKPAKAAKGGGPSYPEVRAMLEKAADAEALETAGSLISSLPQQFRGELYDLAKARKEALA